MSLYCERRMAASAHSRRRSPLAIGWREWVGLPEFGVRRIKAKIDTGARTSALHAFKLKRFRRDGRDMVRFEVHPVQRKSAPSLIVEAPLVGERTVRSSGGHVETRPVIVTTLELGGRRWAIEVTLTRRDEMGFRMLLGRRALRRRVIIDPAASFVTGADPAAKTHKTTSAPRRATKRSTTEDE